MAWQENGMGTACYVCESDISYLTAAVNGLHGGTIMSYLSQGEQKDRMMRLVTGHL